MKNIQAERKKIIIIGGGFGGLYAAKALADKNVDVTLIDRKNHHTFQPLLYQVAAAATQQGKHAARNILQDLKGKKRTAFKYFDKGTIAIIDNRRGVAEIRDWKLSGFLASLLWGFVHVFLLLGIHNRLMILREWSFAYFTQRQSEPIITEVNKQ